MKLIKAFTKAYQKLDKFLQSLAKLKKLPQNFNFNKIISIDRQKIISTQKDEQRNAMCTKVFQMMINYSRKRLFTIK